MIKIKKCLICGKEFETTTDHKKYCSEECLKIARKKQYLKCMGKKIKPINCKYCGVLFQPRSKKQTICSRKCKDKYNHKKSVSENIQKQVILLPYKEKITDKWLETDAGKYWLLQDYNLFVREWYKNNKEKIKLKQAVEFLIFGTQD